MTCAHPDQHLHVTDGGTVVDLCPTCGFWELCPNLRSPPLWLLPRCGPLPLPATPMPKTVGYIAPPPPATGG